MPDALPIVHRPRPERGRAVPRLWSGAAAWLLGAALLTPAARAACTGDCDGDGLVSIAELVRVVSIALGERPPGVCPAFDRNGDGVAEIDELIAAVEHALEGCPIEPTPTGAPTPSGGGAGLIATDRADVPWGSSGSPHVSDVVVGDGIYLADGFGGVVAYDVRDGKLARRFFYESELRDWIRCTSLAFHAPSRRLYCAAADVPRLATLDADTGELVSMGNFDSDWGRGYRDLHVVGDTLYLAAFDAGLLRAAIGPDGSLGAPEPYLDGDVVGVEGDAARLLVLDRARGLRIIEDGAETAAIALAGPPLRISAHGDLATVALGSRGVVVIDVAARTTRVEVHPPCVAVDADYRAPALAIACTAGLYLYRTAPTPGTAGWVPADYASLGARFIGDVLIGNDWRTITAYRVDPAGRALGLDAPRGFLLDDGQGIRFTVRNPDDQAQHLGDRVVPPLGEIEIDVPPGAGDVELALSTREQGAAPPARVQIRRGRPRPAFGSPFPIPLVSRHVSFILPDCALQFPALEDLAWLTANGAPPRGLEPLLLMVPSGDGNPWPTDGFLRLWGAPLEAMRLVDALPVAPTSFDVFEARFDAVRYFGGVDVTLEYGIDAQGDIADFDRVYRGAYPLSATVQ